MHGAYRPSTYPRFEGAGNFLSVCRHISECVFSQQFLLLPLFVCARRVSCGCDVCEQKNNLGGKARETSISSMNFYFLTVTDDIILDASTKGSLGRFVNHSCDPNCEIQKWQVRKDFRVGLFAKKDVEAGKFFKFLKRFRARCLFKQHEI